MTIADRVTETVERQFVLAGAPHFVRASIGIAVSSGLARTADDLIREADAAMYRAKELGRGRNEVYDDAMRAKATERLDLQNELARALVNGEFRVHYQPVVALDTGVVRGVETRLRERPVDGDSRVGVLPERLPQRRLGRGWQHVEPQPGGPEGVRLVDDLIAARIQT